MLRDPNSNLRSLNLGGNAIGNEGTSSLANGLANNTKLRTLLLTNNPIDQGSVDTFARLLCNTSSINNIYSSNHTLENLYPWQVGYELRSLLNMNREADKSHVAIKKILKYHPSIDTEPFFEWNMEGEGERNLKALPYVIDWFDRARIAVSRSEFKLSHNSAIVAATDYWREVYGNIHKMKLSAIYQFSQAMPLLFVPASHIKDFKGNQNKRKRDIKCE